MTEYAISVLEAEVDDEIALRTHTIFVRNVVSAEILKDGRPLTHQPLS